jgi:GTPase SAR1 family protein
MGELKTPDSTPPLDGATGNTPTCVRSKLVFVGDCACGKTSLIKSYMSGNFLYVSRNIYVSF